MDAYEIADAILTLAAKRSEDVDKIMNDVERAVSMLRAHDEGEDE